MSSKRGEEAYSFEEYIKALNLVNRVREAEEKKKKLTPRKDFDHKKSEPFCIYSKADAEGILCTIDCGYCYDKCKYFYGYSCDKYISEVDKDDYKICKVIDILYKNLDIKDKDSNSSKLKIHKIAKEIDKLYRKDK